MTPDMQAVHRSRRSTAWVGRPRRSGTRRSSRNETGGVRSRAGAPATRRDGSFTNPFCQTPLKALPIRSRKTSPPLHRAHHHLAWVQGASR